MQSIYTLYILRYTFKFLLFLFQNDIIYEIIAEDIDEGPNAEIHFEYLNATKESDNTNASHLFDILYNISDPYWLVNKTHKRARLVAKQDLKDQYGIYQIWMKVSKIQKTVFARY